LRALPLSLKFQDSHILGKIGRFGTGEEEAAKSENLDNKKIERLTRKNPSLCPLFDENKVPPFKLFS
jgi:hypothetical protein